MGESRYIKIIITALFFCFFTKASGDVDNHHNEVLIKNSNWKEIMSNSGPNTTFIIRSKMNLQGEVMLVPVDCTLDFKKGSIRNGKVVFQNTLLKGKARVLADIEGSLINDVVYLDWFLKGAKKLKNVTDLSPRIQKVMNLGSPKVIFGSGYYKFSKVNIGNNIEIVGDGSIIVPAVLDQDKFNFNFLKNVFYAKNAKSVTIKNLHFKGTITGSYLPNFSSDSIYGEPLIWVDNADKVVIDQCVFQNIENCTYCNSGYTYYGKKQGGCVCLWDVSVAKYTNCEQLNCRHDEQVWIIAVNKPISETSITYTGNYIHDMNPGPNSSAFTCVAGFCLMDNNKVDNYNYPGSMFNVFAKKAIIKNNVITNSYCSSVFDLCEYSYFYNEEVLIEKNKVDAINAALVLGQSKKAYIRNNYFRGLGLYYSANRRIPQKGVGGYHYWYSDADDVQPTDYETIIDGNVCDFTVYDGSRSIAGTKTDYATGKILERQEYNNVGVNYGCGILVHPHEAKAHFITITNNQFKSINSLNGELDNNNLAGIFPHTIRLVNTENVVIKNNVFDGCYRVYQSPNDYTCITVYNYPDEMETIKMPQKLSQNPSEYGKYYIEDNTFNINCSGNFYPVCFYPRMNSFRQTPLTVQELVVRNNKYPLSETSPQINRKEEMLKGSFLHSGPVIIKKQTLE